MKRQKKSCSNCMIHGKCHIQAALKQYKIPASDTFTGRQLQIYHNYPGLALTHAGKFFCVFYEKRK